MKILMVCMGNICRSPSAEAVLRYKAITRDLELYIDSAGTLDLHQGCLPDPRSIATGINRGYDFSGITSRPLVDYDFELFDMILVMDHDNWEDVIKRCPDKLKNKIHYLLNFNEQKLEDNPIVPDPYYSHDQGFEEVLTLIEDGCDGLIDFIIETQNELVL